MYDLIIIRGRYKVETKVLSKEKLEELKPEFLACAIEGEVQIRKGAEVLTVEELAQAFSVPEYHLRDYLYISSEWLNLNFFLTKGEWLRDLNS